MLSGGLFSGLSPHHEMGGAVEPEEEAQPEKGEDRRRKKRSLAFLVFIRAHCG